MFETHPVSRVIWVDVNLLEANDWNPNHVMEPELRLLAFSIRKQGWIQPILVWLKPTEKGNEEASGSVKYQIIDGFHRHLVAKTDKRVWAMTEGKVPVVVMEMSEAERKLLTIRINRAKGSHAAFRMHEIVSSLVREHELGVDEICEGIGADRDEVNTLLAADVFEKKRVNDFNYSKAWVPPGSKTWGFKSEQGVEQ